MSWSLVCDFGRCPAPQGQGPGSLGGARDLLQRMLSWTKIRKLKSRFRVLADFGPVFGQSWTRDRYQRLRLEKQARPSPKLGKSSNAQPTSPTMPPRHPECFLNASWDPPDALQGGRQNWRNLGALPSASRAKIRIPSTAGSQVWPGSRVWPKMYGVKCVCKARHKPTRGTAWP